MTLSTVNQTDTFESWRQKDNLAIGQVNTLTTTVAAIQSSLSSPTTVTYYVRSDGNDSNNGTADDAADAFLTLQAAIDKASSLSVSKGVSITISITTTGTFNGPVSVSGSRSGSVAKTDNTGWQAPFIITGPAGVVLNSTTGNAVNVGPGSVVKVTGGLKVQSSSGHAFQVDGGILEVGSVVFGVCSGDHINAINGGFVFSKSNYTIAGNASHHIGAYTKSLVTTSGLNLTLTGAPAFAGSFVESGGKSIVFAVGNTYTGTASGTRFSAIQSGSIYTSGSLTYLPGTVAGTTASGGNYESFFTLGNLDATVIGQTTAAAAWFTDIHASGSTSLKDTTLNNGKLSGVKQASYNSGIATAGTTGTVNIDWTLGSLASQAQLTGAINYTFTDPDTANTWVTIMGASNGTSTSYTTSFPARVIWYGATFTATTVNKKWMLRMFWDGTNYHAFGASQV